jgi:chitosanase
VGFCSALRQAAKNDPIMQSTQDEFFDSYYYHPAFSWFEGFGFKEPLSLLVIYDSFILSGGILPFLRQRFAEKPPKFGGYEKTWISQYVNARHTWLANHSNKILQYTVYRTRCFKVQIRNSNWDLVKMVNANGVKID